MKNTYLEVFAGSAIALTSGLMLTGCTTEAGSEITNEHTLETEEFGFMPLSTLTSKDLPLELADGYSVCSFNDSLVFSDIPTRYTEQYDFSELTAALNERPGLQRETGLFEVTSCEDARSVVGNSQFTLEDAQSEEPPPETGAPKELVEKIHLGDSVVETTSGIRQQGIVELTSLGCSGFFISGRHIVTSAHCVPSSSGSLSLGYRAPGLSYRIDTFSYERKPGYQSGDRSSDIAVLTRSSGSLNWADTSRRFRLYTGSTTTDTMLSIYGYGAEFYNGSGSMTGDLRTGDGNSRIRLVSHQDGYFQANARDARICKGDSGGPAIWQQSGDYNIVWGVAQSGQLQDGDRCPHTDKNMYWTKANTNIGFIEDALGYGCDRFSGSEGSYARCW